MTDTTLGEDAPSESVRASRIGPGTLLALAGSAALAVSTALAWAVNPYDPASTLSVYPSTVPLPPLIRAGAPGMIPTLGFVLVTLAVLSAGLAPLGARSLMLDLLRRFLGLLALALPVLFARRYLESLEIVGGLSLPDALRLGFYLAIVGSLLIALGGRWGRRAEP